MSTEVRRGGFKSNVQLVLAYFGANLAMETEYRGAFLARVLSMLVNDCMWVTYWIFYFEMFPAVRGWQRIDVITLWAMIALGFGTAMAVAGNCLSLSRTIYSGEMDVYLTQPRSVLLQSLVSRSSASTWGDVAFGISVFAVLGEPTPTRWLLFFVGSALAGLFFVSFSVLAHSVAFYAGNAEGFAATASEAMLHFSTYPVGLYDGWVKTILFTLIPAGFVSYLPVGLLRSFSWQFLGTVVLAACAFCGAALWLFGRGLRRYESGNLVQGRM